MNKQYKHIIWDWNGTLLNDIVFCLQVLNDLLNRRRRASITREDYRRNFGFPVVHFYHYLGLETDTNSFHEISHEFIRNYETDWFKKCTLHPETSTVLTRLTQLGLTHSVLSAARQEALDSGILYFGIRDHFLGLMGASNIYAEGKIAQGKHWISQLNWLPEEIVLVGDTVHDFEVAKAIGTDCILMAHGHHNFKRLSETGAPVIHSLNELLPFFEPESCNRL